MKDTIRHILAHTTSLSASATTIADDDDLYAAGLSSLTTVHLMLAIEEQFAIEIPDRMLTRRLFSSIDSIANAISQLQAEAAAS
jgi:acyl carrier protein